MIVIIKLLILDSEVEKHYDYKLNHFSRLEKCLTMAF